MWPKELGTHDRRFNDLSELWEKNKAGGTQFTIGGNQMKDLGYRVRKEREKLGMNMRQFTKYLNVSRPAILNLEDGGGTPHASTVTKIVKKFGWKDGEYAEYYYGVCPEEARTLIKQARDKANRLGLNKAERYKVIGTSQGTWDKWKTEMNPRGKRLLLKFLDTSDEMIKKRVGREFPEPIKEKNPMSGAELRKHRERYGYTLVKLGYKLGVDGSTIFKWEKGTNSIPAHQIRKLYKIFDLEYYEIKPVRKSDKQRELERQQRIELMNILDRKVDNWTKLPDGDEDFIAFQKLVGAKV